MPFLDVSELLLDPDFADALVCERKTQTVGTNGRATETTQETAFTGVVTSDRGDVLERRAQGELVYGSINVHSQFLLSDSAGGTRSADVVVWNGRRYTVSNVNDYSRFGKGFIVATCDLIPVQG